MNADFGRSPEQPVHALDSLYWIVRRNQLVILLSEVLKACTRFPNCDRLSRRPMRINYRRNLPVWSNLRVWGNMGFILQNINGMLQNR